MAKSVNVKLFGPWNKVRTLLNNLKPNLKEIAVASQRTIAERYVRKVKAHLRNQDIPGWTPLSNRYADTKMAKYGHEDILVASWEYYESIRAWRENGVYHAGVPRGLTYDNGTEISRVAAIHEAWSYASGRPYRPLWDYTIKEDMGGLRGLKAAVNEVIKTKLKQKGYPINSFRF